MDNFQSITASPEALAAFLGSIPAIETPWDEAFHRLCCSSCSAAEYCKNSPLNFCTEVLYAWAKEEAL